MQILYYMCEIAFFFKRKISSTEVTRTKNYRKELKKVVLLKSTKTLRNFTALLILLFANVQALSIKLKLIFRSIITINNTKLLAHEWTTNSP